MGKSRAMARPVWNQFDLVGLVDVPVRAYTAGARDHGARCPPDRQGEQVAPASATARSRRKLVTSWTRTTSRWDSRYHKGRYVTFDKKEDFDELKPESTKAVEVTDFVELASH